ncbi:hypothetical protein B0H11DRAFT_1933793 [Mycena galericulata]|nr:hypothetical protein B0H11DRAFT_1933793 [Mycena galericulata]
MTKNKKDKDKVSKKKKKDDSNDTIRSFTVTEDNGALVCNCPDFEATGKPCREILAVRIQKEFGPAKPYLGYLAATQGLDVHGPKPKGKTKAPKAKPRTGGRGPRPIADYKIQDDLDSFLEKVERGYNPFKSDDEFSESDREGEPERKKSKQNDAPGAQVSSGRPPATTPLHSGRASTSPAKFSKKPGPKGKGKNSLLPRLPPTLHETPAKKGKPLDLGSSANEQQLDLTAEDLDILDIDWLRWDQEYKLRADEADEMGSLLEALSLSVRPAGRGILVLGPSYAFEAQRLRNVDWMLSDDEPIDATGSPAFPENSVLKKAWLHSQRVTLEKLLVFHHDPVRDHWLLFLADLSTDDVSCYEPLGRHGDAIDIEDIVLIAKFFKPQRQPRMPPFDAVVEYRLYSLDIQHDGTSCGFWMVTIAFLLICDIEITKGCIKVLNALGVKNLKEHWKCLLTSWRIEEKGLGTEPVNNFLAYWGIEYDPRIRILAHRPNWIPRFDPQGILQLLNGSGDSEPPSKVTGNSAPDGTVPTSGSGSLHQMPTDEELERVLIDLQDAIKHFEAHRILLTFNREALPGEDLERFINFGSDKGRANDEVINIFVAILNWMPEPVSPEDTPLYYGSIFGLSRPPRNYKVLSTFFYAKLKELLAAEHPVTGNQKLAERLRARLGRWFKKDDFSALAKILIPVNEPHQIHWLLFEIRYEDKLLNIYDSWGDNQIAYYNSSDYTTNPYRTSLACILQYLPSVQLIVLASQIPTPTQSNAIDCGFFVIMVALHLVYFAEIHHSDCPPNLHFSAKTMKKNRTILATSLIDWCMRYQQASHNPVGSDNEDESVSTEHPLNAPDLKMGLDAPEAEYAERQSPVPSSVDGEEEIIHSAPPVPVSIQNAETDNRVEMHQSPVPSSVDGEEGMSEQERDKDESEACPKSLHLEEVGEGHGKGRTRTNDADLLLYAMRSRDAQALYHPFPPLSFLTSTTSRVLFSTVRARGRALKHAGREVAASRRPGVVRGAPEKRLGEEPVACKLENLEGGGVHEAGEEKHVVVERDAEVQGGDGRKPLEEGSKGVREAGEGDVEVEGGEAWHALEEGKGIRSRVTQTQAQSRSRRVLVYIPHRPRVWVRERGCGAAEDIPFGERGEVGGGEMLEGAPEEKLDALFCVGGRGIWKGEGEEEDGVKTDVLGHGVHLRAPPHPGRVRLLRCLAILHSSLYSSHVTVRMRSLCSGFDGGARDVDAAATAFACGRARVTATRPGRRGAGARAVERGATKSQSHLRRRRGDSELAKHVGAVGAVVKEWRVECLTNHALAAAQTGDSEALYTSNTGVLLDGRGGLGGGGGGTHAERSEYAAFVFWR